MHEVRLHKKPCLAGAGAADHKDIFIPCVLWLLRAAVHRQPFRLREQHIVLKNRVDVGLYIFGFAPTCRAVLHAFAVFLRVLAFDVDGKPDDYRARNPDQQVGGVNTRKGI